MQNYLLVSTLIENSSDIIHTFSKSPKNSGCNIVDSRFSVFGKEIAIILFLSGTWDAIAKVEDMLSKLASQHNTKIITKRTAPEVADGNAMPYAVDVVGVDQPGLVFSIADFMAQHDLAIQELSSDTYEAPQTAAKMFSLHMTIKTPVDLSIATVRGDFMDLCDRLNLDAIMEPIK